MCPEENGSEMARRPFSDSYDGKQFLQITTASDDRGVQHCDKGDTVENYACCVPNGNKQVLDTLFQRNNACSGSMEFKFAPSLPITPSTPGDPINFNELALSNLIKINIELDESHSESNHFIAADNVTPNDEKYRGGFASLEPPRSPTMQDLVVIEMTRKTTPIRSPLFSRVHLSTSDINSQIEVKMKKMNSWNSRTLPTELGSKKCYFKYLNRQLSVSSPVLYQADDLGNADDYSVTIEKEAKGSAMFYVNDIDDEIEIVDNLEPGEMLRSRQNSLRSFRSNASRQSGCTINSCKRISIHSHVDFATTDVAEVVNELTKFNKVDLGSSASLGFLVDDYVNASAPENHHVKSERQKMPMLLFNVIGSLLFPLFSVLLYIWDFGSDIRMALEYWYIGEMEWFIVTLLCIVLPLILMTLTDVSWLRMDRPPRPYTTAFLVKFVFGILTLGRISRAVCHMVHIVKSKVLASEERRRWHNDRAMDEKRDCYMLDFINTFTESVPQLFVQMYLYFTYHLPLSRLRFINIFTSWVSIAWVYAAYYRCNRRTMTGRDDVSIVGFILFLLAVLSCLAARVISIIHFLLMFSKWICAIVLFIHSILAFIWIVFRLKPEMEGVVKSKLGRFLYYLFFAYVYNTVFIHLSNSPGKSNMVLFYVILYVENFTFGGLALYKHADTNFIDAFSLVALPVGLCLHVFFLVIFYKFFLKKALLR